MGSFSWNKADKLTDVENIAYGSSFKFLIPKEFGGGTYEDLDTCSLGDPDQGFFKRKRK